MNAKGGALVVEQDEPSHGEILTFCEKLRIARGLPQKSRLDPARFALISRGGRTQTLLQRPVTANFYTPVPFSTVAKWLGRTTGAMLLVDHAALARQEMTAESECSVVAMTKPLSGRRKPPREWMWSFIRFASWPPMPRGTRSLGKLPAKWPRNFGAICLNRGPCISTLLAARWLCAHRNEYNGRSKRS